MKVIVCGGRDYDDATFAWNCLRRSHRKTPITLVISGNARSRKDARGADLLGEQWAEANNIHVARVPAIWLPAGSLDMDPGAGPKRNAVMLTLMPDAVIAFPGGKGTADMVRQARAAGIPVWEPKPVAAKPPSGCQAVPGGFVCSRR